MTLNIMLLVIMLSVVFFYCYAECRHAECRILLLLCWVLLCWVSYSFIVMLNVVMLSVLMPSKLLFGYLPLAFSLHSEARQIRQEQVSFWWHYRYLAPWHSYRWHCVDFIMCLVFYICFGHNLFLCKRSVLAQDEFNFFAEDFLCNNIKHVQFTIYGIYKFTKFY